MIASILATAILAPVDELKVTDVKVGKGEAARALDLVTVEYTGKLKDGKVFDSTKGKQPFQFVLGTGRVIKGWDQGVAGMKKGGERDLAIPPAMAYGDREVGGGLIPANSSLFFNIKLVSIDRASIKVDKKGEGPEAKIGDQVEVHYRGKLKSGKEFDTSYGRETLKLKVGAGQVIPGFDQGLLGIKKGEKRTVTIPPKLGYGERAVGGGLIPANSTLVFEIEGVAIKS